MKKITFLTALLISGLTLAQEKTIEQTPEFPQDVNKKHEVKINGTNLLIFDFLDVSYEYLIDEESSFGVGALININSDSDTAGYKKSSLTPFYRRYFSNQYARGFFVEGFGMLHSYEENNYDYYTGDNFDSKTEFAIGISIGGKFISKRGFTTEVYLGIGRNLVNDNSSLEAIGRGGISLGYRF